MHTESIPDFTEWLAPRWYFNVPTLSGEERVRYMGLGTQEVETVIYYKTGLTNGPAADTLWSQYLQDKMQFREVA